MFIVEVVVGLISESAGLVADSLDMLADATVYGIGLYAVGRAASAKINAALISGFFQVLLAVGVMAEVVRRLIQGSEPEPLFMIGIALLALIANVICLILISRHRDGEVHMRASWIFSKNDVIANSGVITAGILVYLLDSRIPDLLIGAVIVFIVLRGGVRIIRDALSERKKTSQSESSARVG
jgi:cation diffusion facilitator family transporter